MQNVRNQNLLKLWLSFFCLSLANALASDSVGKIHAVHVNEVIRIKIIQSQPFSLWSICTGSLMAVCHTNHYPHPKEQEGLVDAKTQGWGWASPLHLCSFSSHTSQSDSHDGNVSHGCPDSARYLRTPKCWNPAHLLRLHTSPRELNQRNSMFMALLPAQDVTQAGLRGSAHPKLRLHPLCGTCTHITTTLKGQLKWSVKNCVFSSYINCSYYMKKKKKGEKFHLS